MNAHEIVSSLFNEKEYLRNACDLAEIEVDVFHNEFLHVYEVDGYEANRDGAWICDGSPDGCTPFFVTHVSPDGKLRCDDHGLRPHERSVCLLLTRPDGKILGVTRGLKTNTNIGLPGGKVDATDLSDWEAVIRETKEETAIDITGPVPVYGEWSFTRFCTVFVAQWVGGIPKASDEGFVKWVSPEEFLANNCDFKWFNEELFKQLGIL